MSFAQKITHILGEDTVPNDPKDMDDFEPILKMGLPIKAADNVAIAGGLGIEDILSSLGISKSTYVRKKRAYKSNHDDVAAKLELPESNNLFQIAYIMATAENVFGDRAKAVHWLNQPNAALQGRTPYSMLDTIVGEKRVEALLNSLAWGDPML